MSLNKYEYYSQVTQSEVSTKEKYDKALTLIRMIEECKTITQVKGVLKQELGLSNLANNYKLGTLGHLSTRNTDKYFEVNISYSDEIHICVFPKQNKEGAV